MVIVEVSKKEILTITCETLGLSATSDGIIDDAVLAALLRRAAGILCPCSPATLIAAVLESLQYLIEDHPQMKDRLTSSAEGLLIGGDLLELNQVTIDDPAVKGTWVFAAPPSFVVRPGGSIFLIGIVPDEPTPLPATLNMRIIHQGFSRVLAPQPPEDLPSVLRDLGLLEVPMDRWLKTPKLESAKELCGSMLRRLMEQPASGTVADVSLLDPARNVSYYMDRWVDPTKESGNYVARRPQMYGEPLWGFARFTDGVVTAFLDLPLKGTQWRGCDAAWHLQMAIDHCRGTPQLYRRRPGADGAYLDFFSPLPLWAQRRLAILGRPAPREKCLLSYWIPQRELASEEAFLQDALWLSPHDESGEGTSQ